MLHANEPSPKKCRHHFQKSLPYLGIAALGILDAFLKLLAINAKLPKIGGDIIGISYFQNPGIAFSIPLPHQWTLMITGSLIIIFFTLLVSTNKRMVNVAIFAALTGAGSNFIDRLFTNFTTDYIIILSKSAINIADILILTGIGYCAWYYQKADKSNRQ